MVVVEAAASLLCFAIAAWLLKRMRERSRAIAAVLGLGTTTDLVEGERAKISGVVEIGKPLTSPIDGASCAWISWSLHERRSAGDTRSRIVLRNEASPDFDLRLDPERVVEIAASDPTLPPRRSLPWERTLASSSGADLHGLDALLGRGAMPPMPAMPPVAAVGAARPLQVVENRLPVGERILAIGILTRTPDGRWRLSAGRGLPLILATDEAGLRACLRERRGPAAALVVALSLAGLVLLLRVLLRM